MSNNIAEQLFFTDYETQENTDDCSLTSNFGIIVQSVLAILVICVLAMEFLVERCLGNPLGNDLELPRKTRVRHFVEAWFDGFKICVGAFISHLFNMITTWLIERRVQDSDQCALYALAFYYESCGVAYVLLLQYAITKLAARWWFVSADDHHSMWHKIMGYVSHPGQYHFSHREMEDLNHKEWWRAFYGVHYISDLVWPSGIGLIGSVVAVAGCLCFDRDDVPLAVSVGFFSFLFSVTFQIATPACRWQTLAWVLVKTPEKALWTFFSWIQASYFGKWADLMTLDDKRLESALYIAIVPIIINIFVFLMFSRISRLEIPCLHHVIGTQTREKVQATLLSHANLTEKEMREFDQAESPLDPNFSLLEALKVGVVYALFLNTVLYVIAAALLRDAMASVVLLGTIVGLPLGAGLLTIAFFKAYFQACMGGDISTAGAGA